MVYTIGHSTHPINEFLAILKNFDIQCLVDVRTIPKSAYVPWFNQPVFKKTLKKAGIEYVHLPELGGLRSTRKDSINQGWHHSSFRAYADYMQTKEFFQALKNLKDVLKKHQKCAFMCAEAVPWRCHRQLIADALVVRGKTVIHIMGLHSTKTHTLTPFAVVDHHKRPIQIIYPSAIPVHGN